MQDRNYVTIHYRKWVRFKLKILQIATMEREQENNEILMFISNLITEETIGVKPHCGRIFLLRRTKYIAIGNYPILQNDLSCEIEIFVMKILIMKK